MPHVVARNIQDRATLDGLLSRLTGEAGVDRGLVVGGDRDHPAGMYRSSLDLTQTGALQAHGLKSIFIGCYPEGRPQISDAVLEEARAAKIEAAREAGLHVVLVSPFCFEASPVIALAERMRGQGVTGPLRVGVAGPANRALLMKYALICGVGNSIRVLKDRGEPAKSMLGGETPEALALQIEAAQARSPALGFNGVHVSPCKTPSTTMANPVRVESQ